MVDNPDSLRKQAHSIASSARRPDEAWSELRIWASGKGPLASKFAMIEFVSLHGSSPEAALLIPQLMRDKSLSSAERKEMLSMGFRSEIEPNGVSVRPKLDAPKTASALAPRAQVQLQRDFHDPREMHLALREQAVPALQLPARSARFDASRSPDSHVFSAGSHKGERLIRNLVEKMRGHSAPEHPVQVMSGDARPKPKAARKPARKKARKIAQRKAPKKTKAKARRK